jgi:stearoyl-CoA desaturase (delta-9 desaturase)
MEVINEIKDAELEIHSLGGELDLSETELKSVPINRGVDKSFAVFVTFFPPMAFGIALWMHFARIHSINWFDIGVLITMFVLCLSGIELGFHRLFAHRSFKAHKTVAATLAALGSMAFQGPVIWWASVHRKHHRHSDMPGDPHSMYLFGNGFWAMFRGFIHAQFGWIWTESSIRFPDWSRYVLDLYRARAIFHIHLNYIFWMVAGFAIPAILSTLYYGITSNQWAWGFLMGALWGGAIRIFFMNHLTFWAINSWTHGLAGYKRYHTKDRSTNSVLLSIFTFGQGLHNNHHAFPYSSVMGHKWWEIDIGTWILLLLKKFNLVWDLKKPSKELMNRREVNS